MFLVTCVTFHFGDLTVFSFSTFFTPVIMDLVILSHCLYFRLPDRELGGFGKSPVSRDSVQGSLLASRSQEAIPKPISTLQGMDVTNPGRKCAHPIRLWIL